MPDLLEIIFLLKDYQFKAAMFLRYGSPGLSSSFVSGLDRVILSSHYLLYHWRYLWEASGHHRDHYAIQADGRLEQFAPAMIEIIEHSSIPTKIL